jgi:hypothetical protein
VGPTPQHATESGNSTCLWNKSSLLRIQKCSCASLCLTEQSGPCRSCCRCNHARLMEGRP